ncbi:hypothetical protein ACIBSW_13195 [Actinoplanes sp. NPDC049668]|uniref:hypothetical protein n=1 Tax=unclassified Actinoplanes TaxID=2626549 RepID=UPI0033AAC4B3
MAVAPGEDIDASDMPIERYPIGRMVQAVAQSIPDNTVTALTWTTEDIDTDGFHDTAVNNTRITPNLEGYYEFHFTYYSAAQTTPASMDVSLRKNGSGSIASGTRTAGATVATGVSGNTIVEMNGTTDYVEVMALQDSSGAVNTNASSRFSSHVTWKFLRPL